LNIQIDKKINTTDAWAHLRQVFFRDVRSIREQSVAGVYLSATEPGTRAS